MSLQANKGKLPRSVKPFAELSCGVVDRLLCAYRARFPRYDIRNPVIVLQMGKVGSLTIYNALRRLGLGAPVYHGHILEVADDLEKVIRETRADPSATLKEIEWGRQLRRRVDAEPGQWNLISLVRDPVARRISYFFQVAEEIFLDALPRIRSGSLSMDEVQQEFNNRNLIHDGEAEWFDSQLKGVFGIDVFSRPFARDRGFDIYEEPRARLLVMRLEDLDACVAPAMQQFLGIQDFRPATQHVGEAKWYGELYRRFKTEVSLSAEYLDGVYGLRYARHFYSEEEIARFRLKHQSRV